MPPGSFERRLRKVARRLLIARRLVLVLSLPATVVACQYGPGDGGGGGISHQP